MPPIPRRVASIGCLPQELIDEITDIASTHSDDKCSLGRIASFLEDNPNLLALPKRVTFALGGLLDLAPIAHVLPRLIHVSRWHFCFTSTNPPPLTPLSHICMSVTEVKFEGDLHIDMLSMILPVLPSLRSLELEGTDRSFNLAANPSNFTFPPTFHDLLSWVTLPSLGIKMGTLWATVTTLSSVHACAVSDDAVQGIQGCVDSSAPTLLQFEVQTSWPSWSPSTWVRPFDLHRCTRLRYFKIETYATGGLEACVATISDFFRQEPYYQGGTRISIDLALVRIELQDAYIDKLCEYAWQYLGYLPRVQAVAKINLYWNQWMSEVNPHSLLPEGSEPNAPAHPISTPENIPGESKPLIASKHRITPVKMRSHSSRSTYSIYIYSTPSAGLALM
ncbi:hypothetical protein EDD18DRAFT_1114700 [Armillaria luteobubalina]|uniref:Uncharacterized protein n=1 Tax=Armillaria luteobubalina TaxID=153913 RepID=A0AA39P4M2_9AGAR|nr:hypothetical protein EDD18DRAFT_1114700 [Armillaria luteobubalina]